MPGSPGMRRWRGSVQDWARRHFALFPEERYASQTVTCIRNTRGISVADLNKELGKRNLSLSNGYGKLKEQTFRIAHMGDLQMSDIEELLGAIEDILKLKPATTRRFSLHRLL